jgi:hypothetical protein
MPPIALGRDKPYSELTMMIHTKDTIAVAAFPLADRRRSRVYHACAAFHFAIGDSVAFHDHVAIVMTRSRSAIGREIYYIQLITGDMSGRPFRTVDGGALTACNPYEGRGQASSCS